MNFQGRGCLLRHQSALIDKIILMPLRGASVHPMVLVEQVPQLSSIMDICFIG